MKLVTEQAKCTEDHLKGTHHSSLTLFHVSFPLSLSPSLKATSFLSLLLPLTSFFTSFEFHIKNSTDAPISSISSIPSFPLTTISLALSLLPELFLLPFPSPPPSQTHTSFSFSQRDTLTLSLEVRVKMQHTTRNTHRMASDTHKTTFTLEPYFTFFLFSYLLHH